MSTAPHTTYTGIALVRHLVVAELRRARWVLPLLLIVLALALPRDGGGALMPPLLGLTCALAAAWIAAGDAPGQAAPFFRALPVPGSAVLLSRLLLALGCCVLLPAAVLVLWLVGQGTPAAEVAQVALPASGSLALFVLGFVVIGSASRSTAMLILLSLAIPVVLLGLRVVNGLRQPLRLIAEPWAGAFVLLAVLGWLYHRQRSRTAMLSTAGLSTLFAMNALFANPLRRAESAAPSLPSLPAGVVVQIDSVWADIPGQRLYASWRATDSASDAGYRLLDVHARWAIGTDTVSTVSDDRSWGWRPASPAGESARAAASASTPLMLEKLALSDDRRRSPAPGAAMWRRGVVSMLLPVDTRHVPDTLVLSATVRRFTVAERFAMRVGDTRRVAGTAARYRLADTLERGRRRVHLTWDAPRGTNVDDDAQQPIPTLTFGWESASHPGELPLERVMHAWGGWPLILPAAQRAYDEATLAPLGGASLPLATDGRLTVTRWIVQGDLRLPDRIITR